MNYTGKVLLDIECRTSRYFTGNAPKRFGWVRTSTSTRVRTAHYSLLSIATLLEYVHLLTFSLVRCRYSRVEIIWGIAPVRPGPYY